MAGVEAEAAAQQPECRLGGAVRVCAVERCRRFRPADVAAQAARVLRTERVTVTVRIRVTV